MKTTEKKGIKRNFFYPPPYPKAQRRDISIHIPIAHRHTVRQLATTGLRFLLVGSHGS